MAEVATTTIAHYYARMDGFEAGDPMDLVAPDLQFAIVLPDAEFAGGRRELQGYVDGRDPHGRYHLSLEQCSVGRAEFVRGRVQTDDEVRGAFLATVDLDDAGLIRRYLVTMSAAVSFDSSAD